MRSGLSSGLALLGGLLVGCTLLLAFNPDLYARLSFQEPIDVPVPSRKMAWRAQRAQQRNSHNRPPPPRVARRKTPKFVLLSLLSERNTTKFAQSVASMRRFGYRFKNFTAFASTASDPVRMRAATRAGHVPSFGSRLNSAETGIWLSHVLNWAAAEGPVVTIESDTLAARTWQLPASVYRDYDVVYLHDHPRMKSRDCGEFACRTSESGARVCGTSKVNGMREGQHAWYGCGAMLWTGRTRWGADIHANRECSAVKANGRVDDQIDIWLNCAWQKEVLRVGAICPALFSQTTGHESLIREDPLPPQTKRRETTSDD